MYMIDFEWLLLLLLLQAGHTCGDENDLIGGRPTGAVRVSLGYMSSERDCLRLVQVVRDNFLLGLLFSVSIYNRIDMLTYSVFVL